MSALTLLMSLILFSSPAWSYFQKDMMKAKIDAKSKSRWTLADWLTQKSRNRLQDQWLAMNRSSDWFEFNLGGGYTSYKSKTVDENGDTESNHTGAAYHTDIFISIFNLFGEYEITNDQTESYGGGAGLRLLGTSSQSTGLVIRYGWRKRQALRASEAWENEFVEAILQIYIVQAMGLTGKYRLYGANKSNLQNIYDGSRSTVGAFLEYGIVRAYADYYREPTQIERGSAQSEDTREGLEYGLRFHF